MREFPHLNDVYISERLKIKLQRITDSRLVSVTAPMGYGKSTAVSMWEKELRKQNENAVIYKQNIMGSSAAEFWEGMIRLLQRTDAELAEKVRGIGIPQDASTLTLLINYLDEKEWKHETDIYWILEDVHLLTEGNLLTLLLHVADRMPDMVHIILISRNQIFNESQRFGLGRNLLRITAEDLSLTKEEIGEYAGLCRLPLPEDQEERLFASSGGWIAYIYLNFCAYAQTGRWEAEVLDTIRLIDQVILDPLSEEEKKFLTIMSTAEKFTAEQADFLWQKDNSQKILDKLIRQNAFLSRDEFGCYRYHHLLRRNMELHFADLPDETRFPVYERMGDWYYGEKQYTDALTAYTHAKAWVKGFSVIAEDRGVSFSGEPVNIVWEFIENCPEEYYQKSPDAVMILALHCFSAGRITEMLRFNELLLKCVEKDDTLTEEEKNNYRGESQILLGFLAFNSISGMSEYHRRACALMNRNSHLVNHDSLWTFGSPSVMLLYHSESGALDRENAEMRDCMPYYYRLTDSHGYGSEYVMQAETEYMRLQPQDAEIEYYTAVHEAEQKNQYGILVAAEFLAMRKALLEGKPEVMEERLEQIRSRMVQEKRYDLLFTIDLCQGWVYAMIGRVDRVPEWMMELEADKNLLGLVLPVLQLVQNQVLLAGRMYTRLAARFETVRETCQGCHMLLGEIVLYTQYSAAMEGLGRRGKALEALEHAFELAVPDGILLPFAECGVYIGGLLDEMSRKYPKEIEKIRKFIPMLSGLNGKSDAERYAAEKGLTERELEVAKYAAERRTTREIADILVVSENTVKSHMKHIYEKLCITGTGRQKREALEVYFSQDKKD